MMGVCISCEEIFEIEIQKHVGNIIVNLYRCDLAICS